jgi:hypothetical protein
MLLIFVVALFLSEDLIFVVESTKAEKSVDILYSDEVMWF